VQYGTPFDPLERLREAIEERTQAQKTYNQEWEIADSLIVLPEAFNAPYPKAADQPVREFLEALRGLAAARQVIFVTGILEGRRNSAYLIDGESVQPMCHKVGDDQTGCYDPRTESPDPCNPITFKNACVGALICMDAVEEDPRQPRVGDRRRGFLQRLGGGDGVKIICVPAMFTTPRILDAQAFRMQVPDYWYVASDREWNGPSFIAHVTPNQPDSYSGAKLVCSTSPEGNTVKLQNLS
jgi:predicted amidohydrolase